MDDQAFDPVVEFINIRNHLSKTLGRSIKVATGITPKFPAIDIYETEDLLIIHTEALGNVDKESIDVSIEDSALTIIGEVISTVDVPDDAFIYRERNFGHFSRTIHIPKPVQAMRAKASFKNGELIIKLPKH